jgi:hypothetical protein
VSGLPLIASPTPLIITIEFHETNGAMKFAANKNLQFNQIESIFRQLLNQFERAALAAPVAPPGMTLPKGS